MKRISVTFLSFVISATVIAQTSSANPTPENPVQAITKGIGGIFGALTSVLNPRVAEIKKLHEEGRYEEAREAMLRQSDKYFETELTELKALLKPTLEQDYQEKVTRVIKEISLGPDVSSLSDAAEKLWDLEQYTARLISQLDFFGVSAYSIEAKKSEWIKSYIELVGKYASTTSSIPSGDKAYYIRKMTAEDPTLLKNCNDALTEKFEKNTAALCRLALEGEVWNRLEKKILENDVTRIVKESRQTPPLKRLQSLFATLNNFNIDQTKWREFLKASELELTYVDQRQWLAEQLSPKDGQILIVRLEPEIQQTNRQSTIASEYTSGRETLPNPQYLKAQRYYQEVRQGYQNCQAEFAVNRIGNPWAVNLCWVWDERIRESSQLIDSTPPTISRDLTTRYQIAANEIKVHVHDSFALIALNGAREPVYILAKSSRKKEFRFADSIHPADVRYRASHFSDGADVKSFISEKLSAAEENLLLFGLDLTRPGKATSSLLATFQKRATPVTSLTRAGSKREAQGRVGSYGDILQRSIVVVHARNSLGTGFYIGKKFLLTNEHVTSGQSLVKIEFFDGKETTGVVLAQDSVLDLALVALSVEGEPLNLRFDPPAIGSEVFALGHPKGLKFSLTKGVVSAIREMKPSRGQVLANPYVQTDVAINSGNSGGPLMQEDEVVGINTFKRVDDETEGLGFALLSSRAAQWLKANLPSR